MPGTISPASSVSRHTPQPGRSIFPTAPTFTLDTFSSRDFIVKDFVEALSDSASPPNRRSGPSSQSTFDPKPLIRTFEHALNRMTELSGDLETRENELSGAVRRAEAQHTSNVQTLGKKLDQTIDSFHRLDSSLSGDNYDEGGNAVVKIGERLEELDRQRTRAQDAKFLIQCWMEVSERGELFLLEDIRRQGGGDGKVRCANIARQLTKISQKLDPDSWSHINGNAKIVNGVMGANSPDVDNRRRNHNTRELIEKFLETLEKDLLKSFDEFYRRENFEGMRECAKVLYDFNGGASVIGSFVNQHQFFIDRSQLITEDVVGDTETWERLADPDSEPPGVEPSLQSLIDEVKIVVQEESIIIKRAFPYCEQVMGRFLQRIFQQSIQQRLELVLEKANTISSLAFLRSLQAARSCISGLIDDLKAHGLTAHPEPISSQITVILDQQFDDLFVPYSFGSLYIEREKRSLEELYSSLLFKFTIFHSRKRKIPTTFMKSLAKSGGEILASARDAYVERLESSDLTTAQKAMLLRLAGLKDSENAKAQTEIEVSDDDGVLDAANAKRMLKWLAEAVGRGLELSGGNETAKEIHALLNLLLINMAEIYIEAALDAANDNAVSQEYSKNEPDLSYLSNLRSAFTIMHLMITCIRTTLIPLASSNVSIRREIEKITTLTMNRMEEKVNSIIQRTVDVALAWITKLLATQKKNDFRPRDDGPSSGGAWQEMLQTSTCLSVLTFLKRLHSLVLIAFAPSANLTSFLTELALGLRTALLEHFKKFQVNAAGGLMITKDITRYIELLRGWDLKPTFEPTFEVLTEVGNMFVIGPEALRERLRGKGALGGLWEKGDMRPYVLRRDDAGSVGIQSVLSTL
ncbi:Exocyst complex component 5 [Pseudocyphellaria aurata]|nr:Exocyst complex component 5 [Pseudocyphellaria aurata]